MAKKKKSLPALYWFLTYFPLILIIGGLYTLITRDWVIACALLLIIIGALFAYLTRAIVKEIKNRHRNNG